MSTPEGQSNTVNTPRVGFPQASSRRVANPFGFGDMTGLRYNPIIVEELTSPPRPRAQTTTCQDTAKLPLPHAFAGMGSGGMYDFSVSRLAIADMSQRAHTATGHPNFTPNTGTTRYNPFSAPMSSQYPFGTAPAVAPPPQPAYQSAYALHHMTSGPSMRPPFPLPFQTEGMLRDRVAQHIRKFTGPNPKLKRKRGEPVSWPSTLPPAPLVPVQRQHITEHTLFLTSCLLAYDTSPNQAALREDIEMLASLQTQYMAVWLRTEEEQEVSMKRRKIEETYTQTVASAQHQRIKALRDRIFAGTHIDPAVRAQTQRQETSDRVVRGVLSAEADIWQDGSGMGVADAFTTEAAAGQEVERPDVMSDEQRWDYEMGMGGGEYE
ncbi:hypothetical protein GMOD_00009618 [Pyrenophora seminiperda CCB06]|uniref:Uncharacterized protein n=1 Tax=Pyrenophora seminiperda CCB06 TaxID=1302712 RepID=A0A3M7MFG6_9PLEO|nr:hypothetical protein GMOD_00009618 [Pyrenophora seminiperda CCB06]